MATAPGNEPNASVSEAVETGRRTVSATGTAYGVQLQLEGSDSELLAKMLSYMPPAWQPGTVTEAASTVAITRDDTDLYTAWLNGGTVGSGDEETAFDDFERSIRLHIALRTTDYFFLHAGAVAHGGRGIVILGASFSGKTTLVDALVRAGCAYFSDENAVIAEDGLLHPYPKPLGLRLTEGRSLQTPHHVETLGGIAGVEPARIALVVAPNYRPGSHWEPTQLSSSETVQILVQHAYLGLQRPRESMRAAHAAARESAGLKGDRGEADETAALILGQMAQRA